METQIISFAKIAAANFVSWHISTGLICSMHLAERLEADSHAALPNRLEQVHDGMGAG
jgi:hypothetical protein